jgi:hypothetical protein
MEHKVGDIICIEGEFVKIARRKPYGGIAKFQLEEFIPVDEVHGMALIMDKKQLEVTA